MSLTLADSEPLEVTSRTCARSSTLWADASARTRRRSRPSIRAFWAWAEEEEPRAVLAGGEAATAAGAAARGAAAARRTPTRGFSTRATAARSRGASAALLDLRHPSERAAGHPARDFDLARTTVTVFGKGQKSRVIPLRGRIVLELEDYLLEPLRFVGRPRSPTTSSSTRRSGRAGQVLLRRTRSEPLSGQHRASLVVPPRSRRPASSGDGMRAGLNMHRARHTFATELRRVAGIDAASQALGHSDLSTTLGIYGHYDLSDLERAMEACALAKWKRRRAGRLESFQSHRLPKTRLVEPNDGGGGNRTRVRGRTGQNLYERRLPFAFARRPVGSRPTDGLAILRCRASGDWLSLCAEPDRWRRLPGLGPNPGRRRRT